MITCNTADSPTTTPWGLSSEGVVTIPDDAMVGTYDASYLYNASLYGGWDTVAAGTVGQRMQWTYVPSRGT